MSSDVPASRVHSDGDPTQDAVQKARDAFAQRRWQTAFEQLTVAARAGELPPSDLAMLAEAGWWSGHLDACIDARERAYKGYLDAGDVEHAAFVALMLVRHNAAKAASSAALGWLKRAERLLHDHSLCSSHGYLALIKGGAALEQGDCARARSLADEALELGRRFEDPILHVRAIHLRGNALLREGRVAEGIDLIDEAVATVVSGQLGPDAVGTIYCLTIQACHDLVDIRRASEWTEATQRWCDREELGGFPGICRVFRAELSRIRGDWDNAEREAQKACVELRDFNHVAAGAAFNELGTLRLRMGDFGAAEDAFQQGYQLGHSCQPGLALLRLASGKTTSALLSIQRSLEDERGGPLARARMLPALVQIALTAGRIDLARPAALELEDIATLYSTPALRAAALSAAGDVELAEQHSAPASRRLREALRLWMELDAPYETAHVRTQLARAHRLAGDVDSEAMELRAARSTFELLGATVDVARVTASLTARSDSSARSVQAPTIADGMLDGALADRFSIEREIGRGAMASVYLATDLRHRRSVAIKVMTRDLSASTDRFLSEVALVARLNHPHIVPMFDSGEVAGQLYYVMPYVAGETLRDLLRRESQLSIGDVVRIGCEVSDALGYAHAEGVIHRDIKPENILLQHGHAFVADFGIARAMDASGLAPRLTNTGLFVGTPAYVSPEQAMGESASDGRSDIYSLGCVLYEMLTGEPPFGGSSVRTQIAQRLLGLPRSPSFLRADTPHALETVVMRALAPEPSERYQMALALRDALAETNAVTA